MTVVTSTPTSVRTSRAGAVCLVAGVVGAAQAVWLAVTPATTTSDRWSYPLAGLVYVLVQITFFAQHLGLVAGLLALRSPGDGGRMRRLGVPLAVVGMLALAVVELVAIRAVDEPASGDWATGLGAAYGVATLLVGVGLMLAGIAIARRPGASGAARWLPLALGVYVVVPLTPALVGPFVWGRIALVVWMLGYAWLGWALMRYDRTGD